MSFHETEEHRVDVCSHHRGSHPLDRRSQLVFLHDMGSATSSLGPIAVELRRLRVAAKALTYWMAKSLASSRDVAAHPAGRNALVRQRARAFGGRKRVSCRDRADFSRTLVTAPEEVV